MNKLILSMVFISICTLSANAQPFSHIKSDSLRSKILDLYQKLKGTKYIEIKCDAVYRDICLGLVNYLKPAGFQGQIIGADVEDPYVESLCEIVEILPEYQVLGGQMENIKLTFKFCDSTKFIFYSSTKLKVPDSYFNDLDERSEVIFKKMAPIVKPKYDSNYRSKINVKSKVFNADSIVNILRKKGPSSEEGIYEQVGIKIDSLKLVIAVFRSKNGFEIIYLRGFENFRDWVKGETVGSLFKTGVTGTYKAKLVLDDKSIRTDIFGSISEGSLRLTTSSALNFDQSSGQQTNKSLATFIKVVSEDSSQSSSSSRATCFSIDTLGHFITNYHVIENATDIYIVSDNGKTKIKCVLVAADKNNDLAILKAPWAEWLSFPNFLINKTPIAVGSKVFVLGFPATDVMGAELKVTDGIISSRTGVEGDISTYQMSAPIQPGNSGSPVFDEEGNLVAVANAGLRYIFENVSYAVKSTYLNNFLTEADIIVTPPTVNKLKGLSTADKVKALRKYVYIIEVEK